MFFNSSNHKMRRDWQKAIRRKDITFSCYFISFVTYLGSVTISLVTVTVAIL